MKELEKYLDEAKEIAKNAKDHASAASLGVTEKVQGMLQDTRAGKELRQGITELEALPEVEGSIMYTMELETVTNYLRSLILIINDKRMDKDSSVEEIKKVIEKVQPSAVQQDELTDEQKAVESVKAIAFNACLRALDALD